MEIKIEKNIAMPWTKDWSRTLSKMDPGDSFYIPIPLSKRLGSSLRSIGYRKKIKLATRTENEGTRVWRLT